MFKNHPKGLIPAALANMGERFGYYIMNAVLALFLVSKFGLSDYAAGLIYSVFYCGIYVLSLVGGLIADRTQNYNRTIQWGLIIMALGYIALSVPVFSQTSGDGAWWGILIFTCFALLMIAFGNGLFKGNLQAIVGKMYDEFEAEAAKKGPEALAQAKEKRDSGFQIFYVFINIGGLVAPFIAPLIRQWWLKAHDLIYNADMPALCHQYLKDGVVTTKFTETLETAKTAAYQLVDNVAFCQDYIEVFNQGIHFVLFRFFLFRRCLICRFASSNNNRSYVHVRFFVFFRNVRRRFFYGFFFLFALDFFLLLRLFFFLFRHSAQLFDDFFFEFN